jgi:hypothetical protein
VLAHDVARLVSIIGGDRANDLGVLVPGFLATCLGQGRVGPAEPSIDQLVELGEHRVSRHRHHVGVQIGVGSDQRIGVSTRQCVETGPPKLPQLLHVFLGRGARGEPGRFGLLQSAHRE